MLLKGFMASCFRKKKEKIIFHSLLVAGAELAHFFRRSSADHPALSRLFRRNVPLRGTSDHLHPAFLCTAGLGTGEKGDLHWEKPPKTAEPWTACSLLRSALELQRMHNSQLQLVMLQDNGKLDRSKDLLWSLQNTTHRQSLP